MGWPSKRNHSRTRCRARAHSAWDAGWGEMQFVGFIWLFHGCIMSRHLTVQLAAFMTHIIRIAVPGFQTLVTKTSNFRWQLWGCCLSMRWNPDDRAAVMDWMSSECGTKQIHKVKADLSPTKPACVGPLNAGVEVCRRGLHRWFRCVSINWSTWCTDVSSRAEVLAMDRNRFEKGLSNYTPSLN